MAIPKVTNSGVDRIKKNHPWLRVTDLIDAKSAPARPSLVPIGGQLWLCSPASFLRFRRIGPRGHFPGDKLKLVVTNAAQAADFLKPWLLDHLKNVLINKIEAFHLQSRSEAICLRWIFSENDFIPGLIIDAFQDKIIAQLNSAPMEWLWPFIKDDVLKIYSQITQIKAHLIELRNSSVRLKENLPLIVNSEINTDLETTPLNWNGLIWNMAPGKNQKTGSYLDQRENHIKTKKYAETMHLKNAWDLCSYEGGFTLHLLKAGLTVTAVDQSEHALEVLMQNIKSNELDANQITISHSDLFDFLDSDQKLPAPDLIVLDPPSFVKNVKNLSPALKAYTDLNSKCMSAIQSGGLLVSCVCSQAVNKEVYKNVLIQSAAEARRKITILEMAGPSADHAPLAEFPEGDYLQAWFIKVD
jgi:23S rRNA (cytosine1962-C5)-methyltransferase